MFRFELNVKKKKSTKSAGTFFSRARFEGILTDSTLNLSSSTGSLNSLNKVTSIFSEECGATIPSFGLTLYLFGEVVFNLNAT